MKSFPIEALSHAPLTAMMKTVKEHRIKAGDERKSKSKSSRGQPTVWAIHTSIGLIRKPAFHVAGQELGIFRRQLLVRQRGRSPAARAVKTDQPFDPSAA